VTVPLPSSPTSTWGENSSGAADPDSGVIAPKLPPAGRPRASMNGTFWRFSHVISVSSRLFIATSAKRDSAV
jgi:hypothetical protein